MATMKPEDKHIPKCAQVLVVASFTEVKTGYRGFEMKRNPVFCMLVLCIENYLQA